MFVKCIVILINHWFIQPGASYVTDNVYLKAVFKIL